MGLMALAAMIVVGLGAVSEQRVVYREPAWGATFSLSHAQYLRLDWRDAYTAISDDLGVNDFRIPINWNWIEPQSNVYDTAWLDELVSLAEPRGDRLTFVVGQKVPRWPECHFPDWVRSLDDDAREAAALDMVRVVVERYRWSPAVVAWQVENEPFFPFGQCPAIKGKYLQRAVALVRSVDPSRLVVLTDSGELGDWMRMSAHADTLGVSLYRATWNPLFGQLFYPQEPDFYRRKARVVAPRFTKSVFISELQVEPWGERGIVDMDEAEQFRSMPVDRVREHIAYARATNFPKVYLWGVEWWYWRLQNGDSRYWELGKEIFEP